MFPPNTSSSPSLWAFFQPRSFAWKNLATESLICLYFLLTFAYEIIPCSFCCVSTRSLFCTRGCVFVPLLCGNSQGVGQERQLDQGNVNEVFHPTVPVIPRHVCDGMAVVVTAGINTAGLCPVVEVFEKAQPCVVLQQLKFLEQENLKTCGAFAICAFHSFVLYLAWKSKQIR